MFKYTLQKSDSLMIDDGDFTCELIFTNQKLTDKKMIHREEILGLIIILSSLCKAMLKCPTIKNHNHKKLSRLVKNLEEIQMAMDKLTLPCSVMTGLKVKYDINGKDFYADCDNDKMKRISEKVDNILNKIHQYQLTDSDLKELKIEEYLHSFSLCCTSNKKD